MTQQTLRSWCDQKGCSGLLDKLWDCNENAKRGLNPESVGKGSDRKAVFLCPDCGSKVEKAISNWKAGKHRCKKCGLAAASRLSGRSARKTLMEYSREMGWRDILADAWVDTDNRERGLDAKTVPFKSHDKAVFRCPDCRNTFERQIANWSSRERKRICGPCSRLGAGDKLRLSPIGQRAAEGCVPEQVMLTQWDGEANGDRDPQTVSPTETEPAAWLCGLCGYRWDQSPRNRRNTIKQKLGKGQDVAEPVAYACPKRHRWSAESDASQRSAVAQGGRAHLKACARRQQPGYQKPSRSLGSDPEKVAELHPILNDLEVVTELSWSSHEKVWWSCSKSPDHVWLATVSGRTRLRSGCPFCAAQRPSITSSVAAENSELASQFHPVLNGPGSAIHYSAGSSYPVRWVCPKGPGHIWSTSVAKRRNASQKCPFCANLRVGIGNSLSSSQRPEIVAQWHPIRNAMEPIHLSEGYSRKVWWKCPDAPDHEWPATVRNRSEREAGCPACNGKLVSISNSLAESSSAVAAQWHPTRNGDLGPIHLSESSSRATVWWKCLEGPDHEWQTRGAARNISDGRPGCSICHKEVSVTNSFSELALELAPEWHPVRNEDLRPIHTRLNYNQPVWWKCAAGPGHEWRASPNTRSGFNAARMSRSGSNQHLTWGLANTSGG